MGGVVQRDLPFRAKRTILVLFAALLVMVIAAPWALPQGSVEDLSGRPTSIDNRESIDQMNPFSAAVYLLGDVNCHQKVERSFFLNGNQMPFCARDVGIFIGLTFGMLVALVFPMRLSWTILVALSLPILVDGGLQYAGFYESTNLVRLVTGILGGIAVSYFLAHVADRALTVEPSTAR